MLPHRAKVGFAAVVLAGLLASAAPPVPAAEPGRTLIAVRFWTLNDTTRVAIETSAAFEYKADRVSNPDRIFFDLPDTGVRLNPGRKRHAAIPVGDARLKQIRVAETQPGVTRVVFDLEPGVDFTASRLSNPPRLIVELRAATGLSLSKSAPPVKLTPSPAASTTAIVDIPPPVVIPQTQTPPPEQVFVPDEGAPPPSTKGTTLASAKPATAAAKKAAPLPPAPKAAKTDRSQSMTRVLGLKVGRILIDAGHGGHDTGTIGPNGLYEKDIVLDVAKRVGALIEAKMGAEVIYTRTDDTFIPLERRPQIANDERADLFLSIHANSSPASTSSGVETYYLNFTDNKAVLETAARENAGSQKTVADLKDLIQKIAMHDKIEESRQFAARVQASLFSSSLKANIRTRDRGVRKAPFVVLIGAEMPAILAEVGFVTNPKDESLFRKAEYRQKIAEGLFQGLSRYAATLSQFHVAQK